MKNPILRGIFAIVIGWIAGSIVNMFLIIISGKVIPLPEGVVPGNMDSLRQNIHLFEAKHYIMPFLAHALGTLVGAFVAVKIALNGHLYFALAIGLLFFIGGVMVSQDLGITGTPTWVDLVLAYFPFALLGYFLGKKR